jgi:hypothetical protein
MDQEQHPNTLLRCHQPNIQQENKNSSSFSNPFVLQQN